MRFTYNYIKSRNNNLHKTMEIMVGLCIIIILLIVEKSKFTLTGNNNEINIDKLLISDYVFFLLTFQ